MVRKNIFEILENKWDIIDEIKRIYYLLNYNSVRSSVNYISPIEFADIYCFSEWKNRYSYLNIEDMADDLDIELDEDNIPDNLTTVEIFRICNQYYYAVW